MATERDAEGGNEWAGLRLIKARIWREKKTGRRAVGEDGLDYKKTKKGMGARGLDFGETKNRGFKEGWALEKQGTEDVWWCLRMAELWRDKIHFQGVAGVDFVGLAGH